MNGVIGPLIMPENKEICSIEHPDDDQFFNNLEEFLRSNVITFEMRVSCLGIENIRLHSDSLDGELISELLEFLRKTGESPKIIHFPVKDGIMLTWDSWSQVQYAILASIKEIRKKEFQQIKEWYNNYGIPFIKETMNETPDIWKGIKQEIEKRALLLDETEWLSYVKNNGPW